MSLLYNIIMWNILTISNNKEEKKNSAFKYNFLTEWEKYIIKIVIRVCYINSGNDVVYKKKQVCKKWVDWLTNHNSLKSSIKKCITKPTI